LDTGLRLLHPLMPFVTEELWQRLPRREADLEAVPSIMVAAYPEATAHWADNALEDQMTLIMDLVKCLRSERAKCVLSSPGPAPPRAPSSCPSGMNELELSGGQIAAPSLRLFTKEVASISRYHVARPRLLPQTTDRA